MNTIRLPAKINKYFPLAGIGILVDGMLRLAGHTPETFLVVFRQTMTFGGEWCMVPYGLGIQYLALKTGLKNAFFADQILVMGPQLIPVCCCVIACDQVCDSDDSDNKPRNFQIRYVGTSCFFLYIIV